MMEKRKLSKHDIFYLEKGTRYRGDNGLISTIICYNRIMKWKKYVMLEGCYIDGREISSHG